MLNLVRAARQGLMAAALVVSWNCAAQAANYIVNGGFETGDLTNWVLTPGPYWYQEDYDWSTVTSEHPHTGTYSFMGGAFTSMGYISQTFQTTPGESLTITGFYKPYNVPNEHVQLQITFNDTVLDDLSGMYLDQQNPAAWESFVYHIVATGTSSTLTLGFLDVEQFIMLDDISVTSDVGQTPLPASLALFATGLGALGLMTHRRKRKRAA